MPHKNLFLGLFIFFAWIFSFFSYILVDTNLVLATNPIYWSLQQWLWQNVLPKTELILNLYILILSFLFFVYLGFLNAVKHQILPLKEIVVILVLVFTPFFISHNALSHDIYNYIFNAKIVLEYQGNPHATKALDYGGDLWLRFMHNTHTLSPYGYAWTAATLIPYILGFGKFILIYINLKFLALLSLIITIYFLIKIIDETNKDRWKIFIFALNPLILLETVSTAHNDILMMQFAIMSYYYLILFLKENKAKLVKLYLITSLILMAISVGMKISTVILFPLLIIVAVLKYFPVKGLKLKHLVIDHFPSAAAVIMFLPLFFERSEQFYPWYLIWSLAWLPLIKNKYIVYGLLSFSISSMFRYVPWISSGFNYGESVERVQRIITWSGGLGGLLLFISAEYLNNKKNENK